MTKIADAFNGKKAFIPFITGGDPDLETTQKLILAMQDAGADLIEIGIPFSDPVAEGPVITEADERALSGGCTTDKLMSAIGDIQNSIKVPLVFMTYINPIYTYGKKKFMRRCREIGICGIIVPDMPFDEQDEILSECSEEGITLISMIAPTSSDRIRAIAAKAQGFLYCVSSLGVTGVRSQITTDIGSMIGLVREVSDIPCCVGFGISTPEQAEKMARLSDGAISGSAIVRIIAAEGRGSVEKVRDYVRSMKEAVNRAGYK